MTNNLFKFDSRILMAAEKAMELCKDRFEEIDQIGEQNGQKVLKAFMDCKVSESHFAPSTGYGYSDRGRDTLDRVFAHITGSEDALVRHNFVSGTHTITTALFGILRPGDIMLSVAGKPYDTLDQVIGIGGKGMGSLADFGIEYRQIELKSDGSVDLDEVRSQAKDCKMVYIQRSRGYTLRPSLSVDAIEEIIKYAKESSPEIVAVVDNCYGEFVEEREPTEAGADLIIGSLIKNPGGGIAETGGYIAGRADLVELCSYRMTSPGIGREVGCTLGQTRSMMLGLFLAPEVVSAAVKTSVFATCLFELLGFEVYPNHREKRTDLICTLILGSEDRIAAFCEGIQKGSPVDSFVRPEAWDMPGYDNEVIMAAGTFTLGSSIELSADAPMRPPYAVWMQGGLTFASGKTGVLMAVQSMLEKGLLSELL